MDIWTEELQQRHLPILENWVGRTSGQFTENDFPLDSDQLSPWFDSCKSELGRTDCLISVYETPVGLSGLRRAGTASDSAELYLFLGESYYNPIRTATYATLRMLDRAFQNKGLGSVYAMAYAHHKEYLDSLHRMGFSTITENNGLARILVDKDAFLSRKYLF